MENKTILEILQKKKELGSFADGNKLYSPCFGDCILAGMNDYDIVLAKDSVLFPSQKMRLRANGRFFSDGETMVFPSEKMRDWNRFAWEEYTLLEKGRSKRVFFDNWASSDYTSFIGIDFTLEGDEAKVNRRIYNTLSYHSVADDECASFYETLYHYLGKKVVPFLAERVPLYKEVTDKLILDARNKEQETEQDRKILEKMTEKAILSDMAKGFELTEGKLYYFEDKRNKDISYIAMFRELSSDKKLAFFDWAIGCLSESIKCFLEMKVETNLCVNFRKVNDKEENKFWRVFNDFKNKLVTFAVGQYYTFVIEDGFIYFGKLVSFKNDKSNFTLSDVYCAHRGNKPQYFQEKRFITSHCESLRIASDSDKYFFDGVKASYNERRKESLSLKPKDWCLMRNDDAPWELCQYAYDDSNEANGNLFVAVGGNSFHHCIPYEGNEQLLGTAKSIDDGK